MMVKMLLGLVKNIYCCLSIMVLPNIFPVPIYL